MGWDERYCQVLGRNRAPPLLDPEVVRVDLLDREFTTPGVSNRLWVADLMYVHTVSGWVHVAVIVDVYSQRFVGWHAQTLSAEWSWWVYRYAWRCGQRERAESPRHVQRAEASLGVRGSHCTVVTYTENLVLLGITTVDRVVPTTRTTMPWWNRSMSSYKTECTG